MSEPSPAEAAPPADPEPTTASRALAVVSALLLGAGGLAVGALAVALVGLVVVATIGEISLGASLGAGLAASQVGLALVALAYLRWRPRLAGLVERHSSYVPSRDRLALGVDWPGPRDLLAVFVGWGVAVAGVVAFALVVSFVLLQVVEQEPGANPTAEVGLEQPELLLLLIPAMLLVVGPVEELLFRGVVQGRLREVFGRWPAIGIASVLFAGLHYFVLTGGQPTANAVAVSILLVPAVVLGAAYEYTDNLVVPALIHGLYNSTWLALLYVIVVYTDALEQSGAAVLLVG